MPILVAGEVYEFVIGGRVQEQLVINRLFARIEEVPGGVTIQDTTVLQTALIARYRTNVIPQQLSDWYRVTQYTLSRVATATFVGNRPKLTFDYTLIFAGTVDDRGSRVDATQKMPLFNAVNVRRLSEDNTRFYRGSNRWGPICEGDQQDGLLVAGQVTAWKAALDPFLLNVYNLAEAANVRGRIINFSAWKAADSVNPPADSMALFSRGLLDTLVEPRVTSQVSRKPQTGGR